MNVLGIDTATAGASVALVKSGNIIAEKYRSDSEAGHQSGFGGPPSNHAEILLPLVESLLNSVRLSIDNISGIAMSIGPGSFTGIRVGLATVKGLAYRSSVRVVGVSTLLATAARIDDFDGLICPFLDARKKDVYAGIFCRKGNDLTRLSEDRLASVDAALNQIHSFDKKSPIFFTGDGAMKYESQVRKAFGERAHIALGESYASVASSVAVIGYDRLRQSQVDDLGSLEPVYLRPSQAETM